MPPRVRSGTESFGTIRAGKSRNPRADPAHAAARVTARNRSHFPERTCSVDALGLTA
jgi:hypothetical protein